MKDTDTGNSAGDLFGMVNSRYSFKVANHDL